MNNIMESHPFEPFLPEGAKILMLGTFILMYEKSQDI